MLKCGFYEKEITPAIGESVSGYYVPRTSDDVKTRLYAKAIAINCDGNELVLITIDAIHVSQELCDGIYERLAKFTNLKPEQIAIASTHCHTSGNVGYTWDFAFENKHFKDDLILKGADCAYLALRHMQEAEAYYGCKKVEDIAFIRNYKMKDGSVRTNPGIMNPDILEPMGKPDEDFPFIVFKNIKGECIGSISSYALHHDTVAGNAYCADFSGVLSDELKERYGRNFVSLWLAGFSGNINHVNTALPYADWPKPVYEHTGKKLAQAIFDSENSMEKIAVNDIKAYMKVKHVTKRKADEEEVELAKELIKKPLSDFDFDKIDVNEPMSMVFRRARAGTLLNFYEKMNEPQKMILQVLKIGDCCIYLMNGEDYVEFQHYLKENSPTTKNLFASNSNGGTGGYVPTKEMSELPNLYEAQIPSSVLLPGEAEKLIEELLEMAKEIF